jgi:hypothetical protein
MNAIRITKYNENGSLVLKNLSLTETRGSKSLKINHSRAEIPIVIEENFKIPSNVVMEAIGSIKELKDVYD